MNFYEFLNLNTIFFVILCGCGLQKIRNPCNTLKTYGKGNFIIMTLYVGEKLLSFDLIQRVLYLVCLVLGVPSDSPVGQWKAGGLNPVGLSVCAHRSSLSLCPLFFLSQCMIPIPSVHPLFQNSLYCISVSLQKWNEVCLSRLYEVMMWSSWRVVVTGHIALHMLREHKQRS